MNVYLQPPQPSRGLQRIADALVRYLPDRWEVTPHIGGADLVILYAIGRRDAMEQLTTAIRDSKFQKYAVIQVCLKSTMQPDTSAWHNIWEGAEVVWSYYNLERAAAEDGYCGNEGCFQENVNFYYAPLGADAEVFYPDGRDGHNSYVIATSGLSRLSESVRECALAARIVSRHGVHLGPKLSSLGPHFDFLDGVGDDETRQHFSDSEFISGLRRKEGFELPAVEGLLCGARPICFSGADWKWNYGDFAEYIEETDRQGVIDQLVELFRRGARPVTEDEIAAARVRFNWETIVGGFYERLR